MKKIVSVFFSVMLCMVLVCTTTFAASLDFSFDKETRTLNLGGNIGSSEHQACLVYIYDADDNTSDLSDTNTPVFADMAVTSAGGAFEYSKVLGASYPSGKYRISVVSGEDNWITEFMYTNKQSVADLLPVINGAASAPALDRVISSSATELGLDIAVYSPVRGNVASFVFGNKPSAGFATPEEFINTLDQSLAAALIENGADVSAVLKEYAKAIGIDFEDDYNKFNSSVKTAINTELANADYASDLLSTLYPKLRTVAFMKSAPTWQALKNAFYGVDSKGEEIVSNYSVINPDLTVYNKVNGKDKIFGEMFKQRAKLTSVENIRSTFASCALSVYNAEQNSTQGGGSTGGGGGVSSGPVSIQPGYVNQPTEVLKPSIFTDTDTNAWYYHSLERLVTYSLINGYEDKTFKPENSITRAEFTKLVVGVAKHTDTLVLSDAEVAFNDVAPSDWFSDVVTKAAKAGLVTGSDNAFNPNAQITRQDAAVILYRLISSVKSLEGSISFSDSASIADYAKTAVESLASASIISGMGDGTFAPTQNLTRAQAAKLLYGVLENLS
ncbi:MAG: S-layer homology domain-containing protein [Clostridia bacterium]|nr:S-layer homology domain-containing protein [Clostridia bacterium]